MSATEGPVDIAGGPVDTQGLRFPTPVDNDEVRSISRISDSRFRSELSGEQRRTAEVGHKPR